MKYHFFKLFLRKSNVFKNINGTINIFNFSKISWKEKRFLLKIIKKKTKEWGHARSDDNRYRV